MNGFCLSVAGNRHDCSFFSFFVCYSECSSFSFLKSYAVDFFKKFGLHLY